MPNPRILAFAGSKPAPWIHSTSAAGLVAQECVLALVELRNRGRRYQTSLRCYSLPICRLFMPRHSRQHPSFRGTFRRRRHLRHRQPVG